MDANQHREPSPQEEAGQKEPVKYATPIQRVWAWVGVVYMVIILLLTTYAVATAGYIRGIGGFMLSPALVGLGCSAILRYRQGVGRGGLPACVLVSGACFALALFNVIRAVPVIAGQLMG